MYFKNVTKIERQILEKIWPNQTCKIYIMWWNKMFQTFKYNIKNISIIILAKFMLLDEIIMLHKYIVLSWVI